MSLPICLPGLFLLLDAPAGGMFRPFQNFSLRGSADFRARRFSLSKKSLWTFSPSCFQNCKIKFCSMILQFCRCGGLWNAKGHPDGFLSHFSSLRNFWLGGFSCSLTGCGPPVSVYSIRCAAVNRMFSFDARPSWRVAGNGMPLPAEHLQFVQGVDKTVCTDCVCSGVP